MKPYFTVFICLITSFVFSQNQHALVVYLSDAETGKNVKDAKVTLEGFEIRPILGKYDKKKKYYYFDVIPQGYNTVMAYHKKYNEKGFQDVDGLPDKIGLKLFDPLNVSYSFEQEPYKSLKQKVYVEDPYKIGITSDKNVDYTVFRQYIINEIGKLGLEVEFVNPYLELEKDLSIPKKFRGRYFFEERDRQDSYGKQTDAYPFIPTFPLLNIEEFILPLEQGISTYERFVEVNGVTTIDLKRDKVVFYIRKKNGERFKRYNDAFIKKIRSIKDISMFSVTYYKYDFKSKEGQFYKNKVSRYLDRFNKLKDIDSSKVFYYFRIQGKKKLAWPSVRLQFHDFGMFESLKKQYQNSSKLERILKNSKIMHFDSAIGLGILDQNERIGDSLKLNID